MTLEHWAIRHGVSLEALADLRRVLGAAYTGEPNLGDSEGLDSEGAAQNAIRLEAAAKGGRLWRNNVGALIDARGVPVRYGLANDSAAVNKVVKSSDLIGCVPVVVTPSMVGCTFGQFTAREVKHPGWRYAGTDREVAQLRFLELVVSLGGNAGFATGVGTL